MCDSNFKLKIYYYLRVLPYNKARGQSNSFGDPWAGIGFVSRLILTFKF